MSDGDKDIERYDMLIVPQNRSFGLVHQGTRAVINFLVTNGIMAPNAESVAKEWVEVYGDAGPTAHEAFTRGAYAGAYKPLLEVAVRTGTRPVGLPFGIGPDESVRFYIAFRGVLWKELTSRFKNRLVRMLNARIDVFVADHKELPPHAEVPDDEAPEEVRFARKQTATKRVGTAVEEF